LVLLGPPCLSLQVAQPRRQLADDVASAHQIVGRIGELLAGLLALGLVDRDARGFLEQFSAFLRSLGERLVDESLADDTVSALAQARAAQQFRDVAQSNPIAVQEVLIFAGTISAAGYLDFSEVDREPARGVVQYERHARHAHARALFGTREDHVLGPLSAQRGEALLAEHPT